MWRFTLIAKEIRSSRAEGISQPDNPSLMWPDNPLQTATSRYSANSEAKECDAILTNRRDSFYKAQQGEAGEKVPPGFSKTL